MIDHYRVLKVSHSASTIEIRKAYRKRALELHPDVNNSTNAKEEFVRVNEAYSVLKNAFSKARYDKLYQVTILKKPAKNENRFHRKESSRNRSTSRKSKSGRSRSETFSEKSTKEFKRKQEKSRSWDVFWEIIGGIFEFLDVFP